MAAELTPMRNLGHRGAGTRGLCRPPKVASCPSLILRLRSRAASPSSAWALSSTPGAAQLDGRAPVPSRQTLACRAGSGVTADISAGYSRGAPAPYRWSWQEDGEPASALDLDAIAVTAAGSIAELTAVLRAAADAAPPRACLTPAARSLLNTAAQRLLPLGPMAGQEACAQARARAGCTVGEAAALLEVYGRASQGQVAEPSSNSSGSGGAAASTLPVTAQQEAVSASAPALVATVLAHFCIPSTSAGSSSSGGGGSGAAAMDLASARELADLLWALSELRESLPWDERPAGSGAGFDTGSEAPAIPGSGDTAAPPQACSSSGRADAAGACGSAAAAAAAVAAAPAPLQRAVLARIRNQDFMAPDLCRTVCALGSLAASTPSPSAPAAASASSSTAAGATSSTTAVSAPSAAPSAPPTDVAAAPTQQGGAASSSAGGFRLDPELVNALSEEIRFQLTEFDSDFSAEDLSRLISGMSGLRLGAAVAADEEYHRIIMKAVYGKTRSIGEKGAVDFALSRLMAGDPEARSMHYDARWTHEELRWLPRRERDKRRIMNETWYRTQWGGWTPGAGQ